MVDNILEQMENDGVKEGSLVKLILEDNACVVRSVSPVPYFDIAKDGDRVTDADFLVGCYASNDDRSFHLYSGWDKTKNKGTTDASCFDVCYRVVKSYELL